MMFFVLLSNLMDLLFLAGIIAFVVKFIAKKKKVSQKDIYKQMFINAQKTMNNISNFVKTERENYNKSKNNTREKATVFNNKSKTEK